jgi:hypothetical protein
MMPRLRTALVPADGDGWSEHGFIITRGSDTTDRLAAERGRLKDVKLRHGIGSNYWTAAFRGDVCTPQSVLCGTVALAELEEAAPLTLSGDAR